MNREPIKPAIHADDQQLIELIIEQPTIAMAMLYDRYGQLVFSVALHIVGDRSAAEEVTQDAFVSLWRNAARYRPSQSSLATWLLTITRNRAIDELRSRRSKQQRSEVTLDQAPQQALANEPDIELMLGQSQVIEALANLPPNQREVVELLYFSGLSRPEISQRLQIPLGTIHTRLRLALNKLRAMLLPDYAEGHALGDIQSDEQ